MTHKGWDLTNEIVTEELDPCTEVFLHLRRAMVDYNPADKYYRTKKGDIIFGVGGDLLRREPKLPDFVKKHIKGCTVCKDRMKLLEGKKLEEGFLEIQAVSIKSKTASEKHTKFRGTPDQIIFGMINYYGPPIKTEADVVAREVKVKRQLMNSIGLQYESNTEISDHELLKLLIMNNIVGIVADPWFVYSKKLEGIL